MEKGAFNPAVTSSAQNEIIKQYADILYKTTTSEVGLKASQIRPERPVLHGFNGKFSNVSINDIRIQNLVPLWKNFLKQQFEHSLRSRQVCG